MTLTQRIISGLKSQIKMAISADRPERKAELEAEIALLELEEEEAKLNTNEVVERMRK